MNKFKEGDMVRIVKYIAENTDDVPDDEIAAAINYGTPLEIDKVDSDATYQYHIIFSTKSHYYFSEEELEHAEIKSWKEALK